MFFSFLAIFKKPYGIFLKLKKKPVGQILNASKIIGGEDSCNSLDYLSSLSDFSRNRFRVALMLSSEYLISFN